jgi:polar amino acid transport system substrate-binding protein
MLVAGHVIWLVERQKNADFPHGYLRGVWEGIWWAAVTVATVGYGDRTPRGVGGRLFAMIWMFTGIILVANFTASVTSHLTLQELRGTISGLEDLPGRRVVSVAGTTASSFLSTRAIHHVEVRDIEMAYQLLESGQADAVVYDAPVLLYYAAREGQGKVRMVGNLLSPEEYGIAMPTSSPLREAVNQSLLELRADGTYQQLYEKWFGR